jgi:hypothetical protein
MTATYGEHYARFDQLVRCATALGDVFDLLGDYQQREVLDFLLPGVTDPLGCWEELADPIERLDRLDAITALDELRDQGARGPLDPQSAYDRVRGHIEDEVRDIIRARRTDLTPKPVVSLAVAR